MSAQQPAAPRRNSSGVRSAVLGLGNALRRASTESVGEVAESDGLSEPFLDGGDEHGAAGVDSADDSSYGGMDGGDTPQQSARFARYMTSRGTDGGRAGDHHNDVGSGGSHGYNDDDDDDDDDNDEELVELDGVFESDQYASVIQSSGRFVDRGQHFRQSQGRLNVHRRGLVASLYALDWFHSVLDLNTTYVVLIGFCMYLGSFTLFAALYYFVSDACDIALDTFLDALYFSVETMVTIGYTTADIFFNGCGIGAFLITVQSLLAIFLDAVFIGLVFSRLGRAQNRASSIVFSDKAVMQEVDGKLNFMFQVCELRDQAFVEASVRCIALRHVHDTGKNRTVWFQQSRMRLQQPDDELGSMLFMALPSVVVHQVDPWSPFTPPESWDESQRMLRQQQRDPRPGGLRSRFAPPRRPGNGGGCGGGGGGGDRGDSVAGQLPQPSMPHRAPAHDPMRSYQFPDVLLREEDAADGQRSGRVCGVCGSAYRSDDELRRHQIYCAVDDRVGGHDASATSCGDCGEAFGSEAALQLHRADTGHAQPFSGAPDGPVRYHRESKESGDFGRSSDDDAGSGGGSDGGNGLGSPGNRSGGGWIGGAGVDSPHAAAAAAESRARRERVWRWMLDCDIEIICMVEGMDPITSDTVQALHSYTPAEIAWDMQFAPCVFPASNPRATGRRCCGLRVAGTAKSTGVEVGTGKGSGSGRGRRQRGQRGRGRQREVHMQGALEIDLTRFHALVPMDHTEARHRPSHL